MEGTKWTERKLNFDFPEGWIYNIIESLRGTPARINDMTQSVSDEYASLKPDGK